MVINIRPDELMIAKLIYQNEEREKRNLELLIANKELISRNREIEKCLAELTFRNKEKEKHAEKLTIDNSGLKHAGESLKIHVAELEKMMRVTSHLLREPVVNIIGLSAIFARPIESPRELKKAAGYLKRSAHSLDTITKQLTNFMNRNRP